MLSAGLEMPSESGAVGKETSENAENVGERRKLGKRRRTSETRKTSETVTEQDFGLSLCAVPPKTLGVLISDKGKR